MSDMVDRLRRIADYDIAHLNGPCHAMLEAAAEIERKDAEIKRLRKALDHVRVMECGNKVYIGVIAGDGCCSAESHPDDKTMFLEWKKERDAALTASEAENPTSPS